MHRLRIRDRRLATLLLIALSATLLHLLIVLDRPGRLGLHNLELLTYDWHFRGTRQKPDPRIVIVGMDDDSLDHLPGLDRKQYPLPRTYHARVVEALHKAGARVIGFDLMFTDEFPEDAQFAAALEKVGKVVAGLRPDETSKNGEEQIEFADSAPLLRPYIIPGSVVVPRTVGGVAWFDPWQADYKTTVRYLHIAVALAADYFGDIGETPTLRRDFHLGHIRVPVQEFDRVEIRYSGPQGTYPFIPYHEVYDGTWRGRHNPDLFRDKIVIIGRISPIEDVQATPVGDMQGVEIVANATHTLLQGAYLTHWSDSGTFLVDLALCVLSALAFWRTGLWGGLAAAFSLGAAWWLGNDQLFTCANIWAEAVEPAALLTVTALSCGAVEAWRVGRVFRRFVPRQVAERMLLEGAQAGGHTVEQEMTICFCDVRNFTELSERLPADVTEQILRRLFTAAEVYAQRYGTYIDKFIGDEIMLYFQPRRAGDCGHALRAVRWALDMQEAIALIDRSGIAGDTGFRAGIGISTGVVRIGTVGARERIQHTVIGDPVNIASRLQNATKEVGRSIIVGETTYALVRDSVEAEPLDPISVKGKQEPLRIYAPIRLLHDGTG